MHPGAGAGGFGQPGGCLAVNAVNGNVALPLDVRMMNAAALAMLVVFLAVGAGVAFTWVLNSPRFVIRSIVVVGDVQHNNALTIKANATPKLVGSFFTMDLSRARQAFEAVPWVRSANVRREFPNRLKVLLQEHQAVAYWGADSDSRLLNSFGEIFDANPGEVEHENLPRLTGPDGQAKTVWAIYTGLRPAFEALDLEIDQVELSGRGSWQIRTGTGAQVLLGRGGEQELKERVKLFLGTLTRVAARYGRKPEALESADLRHTDGYALRLRGVTTTSTLPSK